MNAPQGAFHGPTESVEPPLMPYREPLKTWAGHGTGAICSGCGCSIQAHEIEYEVELRPGESAPSLHFHFVCYRNWTGRGVRG
jgi:hypothetical protein